MNGMITLRQACPERSRGAQGEGGRAIFASGQTKNPDPRDVVQFAALPPLFFNRPHTRLLETTTYGANFVSSHSAKPPANCLAASEPLYWAHANSRIRMPGMLKGVDHKAGRTNALPPRT